MCKQRSPGLGAGARAKRRKESDVHHIESPTPRQGRTVYLLRLVSPHGDDIRRLRLLLKLLLRRYQLTCVSVEEERHA
jgi:hypothetical protein